MRPRPLPVLALALFLGVLATGGVLWLRDDGDGDAAATAGTREVAARPGEEPSAANAVPGEAAALTAPDEVLQAEQTARADERRSQPAPAGAVVAAGRVTLPAALPADEELHVVALQGAQDVRTLAGGGAFAAIWGGTARTEPESRAEAQILADVLVDGDGRFRLVLPEGVTEAHLAVSGRYHYSERTVPVHGSTEGLTLTPRLGAWISGTVAAAPDARELAVEGLVVRLFPDLGSGRFDPMAMGRGFTSAESTTDGAGRFEFRGVPTGIAYGMVARTESHAMPYELGLRPSPGSKAETALRAEDGGGLAGRVVDGQGAGVAGVAVRAHRPGVVGQNLDELRKSESGADGTFRLAALPAGELELSYGGDRYPPGTTSLEEPLARGETRDGVVLTLEEGESFAGLVLFPDGSPAAGAEVRLARDLAAVTGAPGMGTSHGGSGQTDAEGAFRLRGLTGGPFVATARLELEEGPHAGAWTARKGKVKLADAPLRLRLEPEAMVRVRVTDPDGEPLEAFELRATLAGTAGMFGMGAETRSQPVTGAVDGLGELRRLQPGDWELVVRADGFAASAPLAFSVPRDATPLEVALAPTSTVLGKVVDSSGAPVGGATVTLSVEFQQLFGGPASPLAVTDAEGTFRLSGVEPGSVALMAEAEGFAASGPFSIDLEPGQVVDGIVLALRSGGTILGLVLDDEGEPQPGRMIIAQRPPDFARQRMDRSDTEGRFVLEHLEPGRWQVTAMRDMLSGDGPSPSDDQEEAMASMLEGMQFDFVEVLEGEAVELVLGDVAEGAVSVRVEVLGADGPVSGAMVSFVAEDPGADSGSAGMNLKRTGPDGIAKVDLDGPGAYLISVQQNMAMGRQSVVEYVETIPAVEEHELQLTLPVGSIAGRVFGPDGDPLAGARVTLTVEGGMSFGSFLGGNYAEVVSDEDGDYRVEHLRPGTYSVAAGGSALGGMFGGSAPGGRVVRGGIRISEGRAVDGVDFHLEEAGTIAGLVRDQAGAPVPGAAVFVRDADGRLLERFSFVASGDDGSFRYTGVQAGRYFVSARAPGRASHESAPVRVAAGETAEVSLRLEAGTTLLVRVVDRSGEDVQARVRVVDPSGHEVSGMLSMGDIMESFGAGFSSKEQRIGPLAPGRYEVEVSTDDGREVDKPVVLDGRPERKITLRLR